MTDRYDAVAAAKAAGKVIPELEHDEYVPPRGGPEQRIEHPAHYRSRDSSGIECLHAIQSALGLEGYRAFLRGQVIKYAWRVERKKGRVSAAKDLQKLRFYSREWEDSLEADE